jgi:hypothetical protein
MPHPRLRGEKGRAAPIEAGGRKKSKEEGRERREEGRKRGKSGQRKSRARGKKISEAP